jgi:hypothetical protein
VPYVRWPHQWISFSTLTTKWRVDKSKIWISFKYFLDDQNLDD